MTNSYKIASRINSDVNASVTYKTDLAQYGKPEHWCLPTDFGDCEDYAMYSMQSQFNNSIIVCLVSNIVSSAITPHAVIALIQTVQGVTPYTWC